MSKEADAKLILKEKINTIGNTMINISNSPYTGYKEDTYSSTKGINQNFTIEFKNTSSISRSSFFKNNDDQSIEAQLIWNLYQMIECFLQPKEQVSVALIEELKNIQAESEKYLFTKLKQIQFYSDKIRQDILKRVFEKEPPKAITTREKFVKVIEKIANKDENKDEFDIPTLSHRLIYYVLKNGCDVCFDKYPIAFTTSLYPPTQFIPRDFNSRESILSHINDPTTPWKMPRKIREFIDDYIDNLKKQFHEQRENEEIPDRTIFFDLLEDILRAYFTSMSQEVLNSDSSIDLSSYHLQIQAYLKYMQAVLEKKDISKASNYEDLLYDIFIGLVKEEPSVAKALFTQMVFLFRIRGTKTGIEVGIKRDIAREVFDVLPDRYLIDTLPIFTEYDIKNLLKNEYTRNRIFTFVIDHPEEEFKGALSPFASYFLSQEFLKKARSFNPSAWTPFLDSLDEDLKNAEDTLIERNARKEQEELDPLNRLYVVRLSTGEITITETRERAALSVNVYLQKYEEMRREENTRIWQQRTLLVYTLAEKSREQRIAVPEKVLDHEDACLKIASRIADVNDFYHEFLKQKIIVEVKRFEEDLTQEDVNRELTDWLLSHPKELIVDHALLSYLPWSPDQAAFVEAFFKERLEYLEERMRTSKFNSNSTRAYKKKLKELNNMLENPPKGKTTKKAKRFSMLVGDKLIKQATKPSRKKTRKFINKPEEFNKAFDIIDEFDRKLRDSTSESEISLEETFNSEISIEETFNDDHKKSLQEDIEEKFIDIENTSIEKTPNKDINLSKDGNWVRACKISHVLKELELAFLSTTVDISKESVEYDPLGWESLNGLLAYLNEKADSPRSKRWKELRKRVFLRGKINKIFVPKIMRQILFSKPLGLNYLDDRTRKKLINERYSWLWVYTLVKDTTLHPFGTFKKYS